MNIWTWKTFRIGKHLDPGKISTDEKSRPDNFSTENKHFDSENTHHKKHFF